jgi:hypothetical protein
MLSNLLHDLSVAANVVTALFVLQRYLRGWTLRWHPPRKERPPAH